MKFSARPVLKCEGAVLAHSLKLNGLRLRKGHLLTAGDIEQIKDAGIAELIVAVLENGDVGEDDAARRLAEAVGLHGYQLSPAGTGRVNFHAEVNGVFRVSPALVDAINRIDPGISLATLEDYEPVLAGRMVATVKIIPYAVSEKTLRQVEEIARSGRVFSVETYHAHKVSVISTMLPALKESVVEKTLKVLEKRLLPSGSQIISHQKVAHLSGEIAAAIEAARDDCDLIVLFGASAICDENDVIPTALRRAGGHVERVGMPVDPGNLLMLGAIGSIPVIGAPGCARSPARNGLDFVLERLLAGVAVSSVDLSAMGVGGLLMEIGSRPQPREVAAHGEQRNRLAGILLAAGQSRRMGALNKLMLKVDGKEMVRRMSEAALETVEVLHVVTGHEAEAVMGTLDGLDIEFVHNSDYREGLSSSLRSGIESLGDDVTHAMVMLGDMPRIDAAMLGRLTHALNESPEGSIIVATSNGKRGNPVIWPRAYFDALTAISGDTGARHLIGENRERVVEVDLGEAAALDIDTPEAFQALDKTN